MLKKIIIIAFSLWTTVVSAQTLTDVLQQCATINSDSKRLLCFDNAVKNILLTKPAEQVQSQTQPLAKEPEAQIAPSLAVKTPNTPPAEQVLASKPLKTLESNFGREHLKSKEVQEFDQVEFVVKSAKLSLRKKWRLIFENGQVWHATELATGIKFKAGDVVVIRRGVLNAFYIKKKGSKRSVRAKRIK